MSTWFVNARNRHDPLEAWLSSSSEDEGASPKDIEKAIQTLQSQGKPQHHPLRQGIFLTFRIDAPFGFSLPSVDSAQPVGYRNVNDSPVGSANSAFSQCDEAVISGPPRRGRRRYQSTPGSPCNTASWDMYQRQNFSETNFPGLSTSRSHSISSQDHRSPHSPFHQTNNGPALYQCQYPRSCCGL